MSQEITATDFEGPRLKTMNAARTRIGLLPAQALPESTNCR
jgi:hypothetical protein